MSYTTIQTPLRNAFENKGIHDIAMCLYPARHKIKQEVKRPIFHYHLEKTAGTAVTTAINQSFIADRHYYSRKDHFHRFSEETSPKQSPEAIKTKEDLENPYMLFSSYVPKHGLTCFGKHLEYDRSWLLMTLFRDPFDRAVSFYYYKIRRGVIKEEPSLEGFKKWASDKENFCYFAQMLSEVSYDGENLDIISNNALNNIKKFDILGTLEKVEEILLGIWTYFDMTPLISEKLHSNPHKKDNFESYREEFSNLHQIDYQLYDYAKHNSKSLLTSFDKDDFVLTFTKPFLSLVADNQKDAAARFEAIGIPIQNLSKVLNSGVNSFSDLFDKVSLNPQQ